MSTKTIIIVLILLSLYLISGCKSADTSASNLPVAEAPTETLQTPTINIPLGSPPIIDGLLAEGEWDAAAVETFADGSQLFLMHAETYLYLAIRSNTPEMIVGNIFIDHGEQVSIHHVSAALGTAVYQKEVDGWRQTQPFNWRCRHTTNSPAAQEARAAFFEEEGWQSVNSRVGAPNELEYQFKVSPGLLRMAANILRSSDTDAKIPWPAGLNDDCILPTPGGLPEVLHFSPNSWMIISIPVT